MPLPKYHCENDKENMSKILPKFILSGTEQMLPYRFIHSFIYLTKRVYLYVAACGYCDDHVQGGHNLTAGETNETSLFVVKHESPFYFPPPPCARGEEEAEAQESEQSPESQRAERTQTQGHGILSGVPWEES